MRILQVCSCFYPAWAYGGHVPVVYHLSRELVERGHEVVVYTTDTIDASTRQKARYIEIEGIKVFYFRNISNSLACGKAVITTSLPGTVAIISGKRDGVIYTSDTNDMTREIVSLLKSTERQQKLGEAGLDYVKQVHSYEKTTRQLEARLDELTTRKRIKNKERWS